MKTCKNNQIYNSFLQRTIKIDFLEPSLRLWKNLWSSISFSLSLSLDRETFTNQHHSIETEGRNKKEEKIESWLCFVHVIRHEILREREIFFPSPSRERYNAWRNLSLITEKLLSSVTQRTAMDSAVKYHGNTSSQGRLSLSSWHLIAHPQLTL